MITQRHLISDTILEKCAGVECEQAEKDHRFGHILGHCKTPSRIQVPLGCMGRTSRMVFGDNSGIGINAHFSGKVIIGKNIMIAPDCTIFLRNHRFVLLEVPMCQQDSTEEQMVILGSDVWIGGHVIILPGIHNGDGFAIGADSVVTKSVEPYAIVAGDMAKGAKARWATKEEKSVH